MSVHEISIGALDGGTWNLSELKGCAALIVNVASRCGLAWQYAGLERLHKHFADRGFTVIGVPCNQFAQQEPGNPKEIREFCATTYGITFPLTEKVDVNGPHRHPLYQLLTAVPDAKGEAGDVEWNFEKFLVAPDGRVLARFRPRTEPDAPEVVEAITAVLPGVKPATRLGESGKAAASPGESGKAAPSPGGNGKAAPSPGGTVKAAAGQG